MERNYIKLKDLDGQQFTVESVGDFAYKMWDNANRKMLTSDTPQKGYQKRWTIDTDKGRMEVSQNQMGKILEACLVNGASEPAGNVLSVKSNGREVPDYYFNHVKAAQTRSETATDHTMSDEDFLNTIPF